MKTNYYVIILDQNNNLCVDSLGECLSEDASLTESNKYRKKHKADVIWTFDEIGLKTLKESLKKYDNQL
jgi:monomeric isocitrate dehydrogenase